MHQHGWVARFALIYLFYLCGNDCMIRYELSLLHSSTSTSSSRLLMLKELEQQAIYNLRNSFSVVGILEYEKKRRKNDDDDDGGGGNAKRKTETTTTNDSNMNNNENENEQQGHHRDDNHMPFYEMVTRRIAYLDMYLNPKVIGQKHSTNDKHQHDVIDCKQYILQNKTIQKQWLQRIPELRIINNLYNVAKEVNIFQQNELKTKCTNENAIRSIQNTPQK